VVFRYIGGAVFTVEQRVSVDTLALQRSSQCRERG